MQKSTTSSPATTDSTENDCVASQYNTRHKTPARTYTIHCGRHGCPAVFVYGNGTDWLTVNCLVDAHYPVCTGQFHGLTPSYSASNTHRSQLTSNPPQFTPESWDVDNSNRDNEVIVGPSKQRQKEDKRKGDLENDEYTEDVQPTSVWCRGCQKAISLDKRSRYYPGLWVKHRGKCPGILKMEKDKLALMRRDWIYSSNPESGAGSFDMRDQDWEGEEDKVMGSRILARYEGWSSEVGSYILWYNLPSMFLPSDKITRSVEDNDLLSAIKLKHGIMVIRVDTWLSISTHDTVIEQPACQLTLGSSPTTTVNPTVFALDEATATTRPTVLQSFTI
ncbi:uncharacterized protein BJ212DRAFT_1297129 [Suillus subaureus]|uniref:Uncharacterized protein n=1 Tax=Suillus subaureus TaxID=48587 RepID=A0A9P7EHX2_9AGAM|nr:uncharacterized protein BJ212DRAFT_1297129 [Suillus subaureus]KAG1821819.1 hypothetical protein BJ212DRAFT_1297129 [Suillus subaureus]